MMQWVPTKMVNEIGAYNHHFYAILAASMHTTKYGKEQYDGLYVF